MVNSKFRSCSGVSLVELLVVCIVMLFVSMAIFGMVTVNARMTRKLENKVNAIDTIRKAGDFIGKDVRMARSFGDIYGNMGTGSMAGQLQSKTAGGATGNALQFPDPLTDPLYGTATQPAGWSGPWPITLSRTSLIVQIPTFEPNGFPTAIPAGKGNPAPSIAQDNMETHVYQIVPDSDPDHPNEFVMNLWKFPGADPTGLAASPAVITKDAVVGPITLVKGIIGPIVNGNLTVFQFIDQTNPNSAAVDASTITSANLSNYTGVVVSLEVKKFDSSNAAIVANNRGEYSTIPFRTEVFMRNQVMSTSAANPN